MDLILKARECGKILQQTEEYKKYNQAKIDNDGDEQLQELINEFNMLKVKLSTMMQNEDKDEEKLKEIDQELKTKYQEIMGNPNMTAFNEARMDFDKIINDFNTIIKLCINGEDPDTCEIPQGCGSNCSSCSGCH